MHTDVRTISILRTRRAPGLKTLCYSSCVTVGYCECSVIMTYKAFIKLQYHMM